MAAAPPSERQRRRFLQSVSRRDYVAVMKAVHDGMSPNVDWKGLLPLRTAVLMGDVDMVALLRTVGADPRQEPKSKVDATHDAPERVITLGKCPEDMAKEMAKDMANPLQRDAQQMLQMMQDPEAARARVLELQKKVEAQFQTDMRNSGFMMAVFVAVLVCAFLMLRYLGVESGGGDQKEL